MNPPLLETRNLCRNFGALAAARDISFRLEAGARHALIGPNGAGKTTFINLLTGVLANIQVNPFLVDAVIGLSVVYKALDNLGAFKTWFGAQPDTRIAVFGFGLVHGFGLATKLQALGLSKQGLATNMISFNVGVELGQLLALGVMLAVMIFWRAQRGFEKQAIYANAAIMAAGFMLIGFQLTGYFVQQANAA